MAMRRRAVDNMSSSKHCESLGDGLVMPSMVFPNRPADNGFVSHATPFQVDPVGFNDIMAMDQSESNTLFRNRRNVQQWAVSSANGHASVMNVYASPHMHPMDTSNGVTGSFPYGAQMNQDHSFTRSQGCQASQQAGSMQDLGPSLFGQASTMSNDFKVEPFRPFDDTQSDAPSLEWGPSIGSNSSAEGGQSPHFRVDVPSSDLLEDAHSPHFHLEIPSPVDVITNSDMFEGQASLYSPSMNSVDFISGCDISPDLLPSSVAMEPCGSSAPQLLPFGASVTDDFMSQFTTDGQGYMASSNYLASDVAANYNVDQGQQTDGLFSTLDASGGSAYDYSGPGNTKAYVSRRWPGDGEAIHARSHKLYAAKPLDGYYFCPFAATEGCKHKPDKLKCNYDKHLDSHLKPYRCNEGDAECQGKQFSSTACLLRHQRERHAMHGHGERPFMCHYEGCDRARPGMGFPRHWNLNDHMKRVHNHVVENNPKAAKGRKGSDGGVPTRPRPQRKIRTLSG